MELSLRMFDCLPYGAIVVGRDLSVLYGNPQFCSWFRQTVKGIYKRPLADFITADDVKVFTTHHRKVSHFSDPANKTDISPAFNVFLRAGDSVRKAMSSIKVLPPSFFGTAEGFFSDEAWYCTFDQKPRPEDWEGAVLVELTIWGTYSSAAGLIEKNAPRLDTAYGGAVVAADLNGTITWMNPLAEKWFGIDRTEARGQNVAIIISEPTSDFHQSFLVRFNTQRNKGKAPVHVNTSKAIVSSAHNIASGEDFKVQIVLALRTEADGSEAIYARVMEHTEMTVEAVEELTPVNSESCPEPSRAGITPLPLKETSVSRGTATAASRGITSRGAAAPLQIMSNRSHMTSLTAESRGLSNDGGDLRVMSRMMMSTGVGEPEASGNSNPVSEGKSASAGEVSENPENGADELEYYLDLDEPGRTDLDREVLILESYHDFVLMRTVVEQGGTGVVVCEPSGTIIHASDSALRLMNRQRKDIEKNMVETLMCDAHTREHHAEYIANYFSRGRKGQIVNGPARRVQMARGDGMAPLPINLYVGEARMSNRKLVLVGLISTAERADQALRAHDKIELAVNSITTSHFELGARAFFHLDENGVIRDCRGHLERLMTSLEAGGSAFLSAASEEEMQMIDTESEEEEETIAALPQSTSKPSFKSRGNATMRIGEISQRGQPNRQQQATNRQQQATNRQQQATNRQQQATNRQQQATNRQQQATNRALNESPIKSKTTSKVSSEPEEIETISPRRKVQGSKLCDIVDLFIEGSDVPSEKGSVTYTRTFPKARLRGFPAEKRSCTVHLAYSQDALGCRCGSQWYGCISLTDRRMQDTKRGLEEAESWMDGAVMQAPDGVLILTDDNIIERANMAASEVLSSTPAGLLDRNINEIFPNITAGDATLHDSITKKLDAGVKLDKLQEEYVPEGWLEARPVNPNQPNAIPGRVIIKVARAKINDACITLMFVRDVEKDRKEVMNRIAEMEKQQQILKHAGEAVVVADSDGVIEMFNAAAEVMFKTKATEAIGKDLGILMPKVVADQHPGYIAAYRNSGQRTMLGQTNCVRAQRIDGEPFAADVRPMEAIVGSRRVFVGVIRDVSTLVTARKDMKQRETKLKKTLVSGSGCLLVCDETGTIKSATEAADKIIGHKFKSLVGRDISVLIPPGESDNHSDLIKDLVAKIDGDELKGLHGDFQAVDGYVRGFKRSPLDDLNKPRLMNISRADGAVSPCEVMIMMSTINGKRMFTIHIRESSKSNDDLTSLAANIALAERLTEQCPEVVVSTDEEGTIQAFNSVAENVFKYRASLVIGKNCNILMPPEIAANHEEKMKAFSRNGGTATMVGRTTVQEGITSDGEKLTLSITLTQSSLCGRTAYTAMMQNITDDVRLKMECARRDRELAAVVNSSSTALMMTDRMGKIVECSTLLAQMFGYFLKDLIGQNVKVLMRRQERELHDSYIERYMQTGEANILGERRLVSCRHAEGEIFPAFLVVESVQVSRSHCFVAVFEEGRDSQASAFINGTANHAHFLIPRCKETMAAAALEPSIEGEEDDMLPASAGARDSLMTSRSNMVTQRSVIPTQRSMLQSTTRSTQRLVNSQRVSDRGSMMTNRSILSRQGGRTTSRSVAENHATNSNGSPDGRRLPKTASRRSMPSADESFGEPRESDMQPPHRATLRQMSAEIDMCHDRGNMLSPGSPVNMCMSDMSHEFGVLSSREFSRLSDIEPVSARSNLSLSPTLAASRVTPKRSNAHAQSRISTSSNGSVKKVPPIRVVRNNSMPSTMEGNLVKPGRRGSAYNASLNGGQKGSASVGDPDQKLLNSLKQLRPGRTLSFEGSNVKFGDMMNAKFDNDREELQDGETLLSRNRGPLSPPTTPREWPREQAYRDFCDSIAQSSMRPSITFKDGVVDALTKLDADANQNHVIVNMYDLDKTTGTMHYLFSHLSPQTEENAYQRIAQSRMYNLGECIVGDAGQRKRVLTYLNVCQAEGFTRSVLAAEAGVGPAVVIPIHYKTPANGKVGNVDVIVGVMEVFYPVDSLSDVSLEMEALLWTKVAFECGAFYEMIAANHMRSVGISRKVRLSKSQSSLLLNTRPVI